MDGVDVALLETDGETIRAFGPALSLPYSDADREVLREALALARSMSDCGARPGMVGKADSIITTRHAEAIEILRAEHGLRHKDIDLIGFHGQTILHKPESGLTIQIGNAALLASRLGRPVVHDFRAADVAAGGQGAPLAPVFHRALAQRAGRPTPIAFLNLGGVANVTHIAGDGELIAFDTGPASALIDDWVQERTGAPYDEDGRLALAGQVDAARLTRLLADPYFALPAPKSIDRDHFATLAGEVLDGLGLEDGAATLSAFTVESIVQAMTHLPSVPLSWIASGGGVHNQSIMEGLRRRLEAEVFAAHDLGFEADFIEAQAFGFMAVRSLRGLPITYPGTTGVAEPLTGGMLARA